MKRMERMLRVHRVKFAGPGFSSMSPDRRKKARRSGLRKRSARWRAKSRKTVDWVGTQWECCRQAVRCREGWTWQEVEENRSKKDKTAQMITEMCKRFMVRNRWQWNETKKTMW